MEVSFSSSSLVSPIPSRSMALRVLMSRSRVIKIGLGLLGPINNKWYKNLWISSPSLHRNKSSYSSSSSATPSPSSAAGNLRPDNILPPHRYHSVMYGARKKYEDAENNDKLKDLARFAVNIHNEKENASLQFVRVKEAFNGPVAGVKFFITLEVSDAGKPMIYYAEIWERMWENWKGLMLWELVDDAFSIKADYRKVRRHREANMGS